MKSFFILLLSLYLSNISAQKFSVNHSKKNDSVNAIKSENNITGFGITHSNSQILIPDNTVLCNNGTYHYENSYYLVYDLKNDFNLNGDWIVENADVAVENAVAGNSSDQPLIVNLYVMSEYNHRQIIRDSLTLLTSDTVFVSDSETGTFKNIDFSQGYMISEGKILVVEFLLPDGIEDQNLLFLGSNNDRISDSTYIRSPQCGVSEPVNVSQILFPDMMLIANVYGQYASPNPEIQSFTIEGQLVNTEIKNSPDYTIKVVMPADTQLTALIPTIQIPAGFQVTPASEETVDFSQGPVVYTVDNNFAKVSQSWDVNVLNAGPDIIDAYLPELNGDVIIDENPNYTVTIPVKEGSDLTNLAPNISVYAGFTVSPESGTVQDFSSGAITYTVSHETLPLTQDWQVSVIETPVGIHNINASQIKIYPNPATDFISVKCENFEKVEIFDINNKIVTKSLNTKINISKLPSGLYFVKVFSNREFINKKLIVIH